LIREDLIFNENRSIISGGTNGIQRIGPYLDIVGGRLLSSNSKLSIEVPLHNGVGNERLVIDDQNGLDLKNTEVVSSTGDIIIEPINPVNNVILQNNSIFGSTVSTIQDWVFDSSGNTLTHSGSAGNLAGILTINGNSVGGGMCCTSDKRMKKNITKMDLNKGLDRILRMQPVNFNYIDALLKEDKWVRNITHSGFIAQDLVKVNPNAVHIKKKTINGKPIDDFHSIQKDEIIVDLVAAVKMLSERL